MYILGIETSCDETSCAVLKNRKMLANITVSSLSFHKKYGGIIPEIATRNHLRVIDKVLKLAVERSGVDLKKIQIIGVTHRPGLIGALVVGLNFAKALSLALDKPFLAVNHLHSHLFASFLDNNLKIPFPFLGLVVSGGHTELFSVKDFDNMKVIGRTRDDAAGEVFDKVARAFGLGYPGGVYIDRIFKHRLKDSFKFKCGKIGLDFSFSGIKTALIYKKMELQKQGRFCKDIKLKLLCSFQESVVNAIVENTLLAAEKFKIKNIVCGGGVIANTRLRELLSVAAAGRNLKLYLPSKELSSDNAAVVAGLTFYLYNIKRKESRFGLMAASN